MTTYNFDVSIDNQKCCQCGKTGKGFYKTKNDDTKYICPGCIIKNIKNNKPKI